MNCICCNASELINRKDLRGYKMLRCKNCSFEFVHPLPSVKEIEDFYTKTRVVSNLKEIIKSYINDFDKGGQAPKRDWFDRVLEQAKKYTQKEKLNIIEIGSGYGYFIHYATHKGHAAVGTEVTRDYAEAANEAVSGEIKYIPDGKYNSVMQDGKADLVYMEHVFEHVLEPQQILNEVKRMLSDKGIFHVSVPNSKSLLANLMGSKWPWACPPDHLYFYNKKALRTFLEKNGFEVLECYAADHYFRSIYQMYSLIPYTNFIRKKMKLSTKPYPYRYPKSMGDIITLLPYWILYPFLKMAPSGSGNELTIIARLKAHSAR
jgi:2-polyprenyl-3-methyl-5-hydroxy-6-metoxy-1,4-benzoquinol methylase